MLGKRERIGHSFLRIIMTRLKSRLHHPGVHSVTTLSQPESIEKDKKEREREGREGEMERGRRES
jgi:hypothetical protein